ncbi:MAG: phosphoesterase [Proteobacteria bacterium]|nr:phosphoesterase [Pseudomonadota bacterium]
MARVLKIFFHDACFDGTTSAALFATFYRDVVDPGATIVPVGMTHRDGDPFETVVLDGDDHACVDFRFCADPKMRWWFDHHATAFQPPALREVFEQASRATRIFDPAAPSCAGLMARALAAGWDWHPPARLVSAVAWADVIDAARFESAEEAVALTNPAQRCAAYLAHGRTREETVRYVEWLSRGSLADVERRPEVTAVVAEIAAARGREIEVVRELGRWEGEVVVFDRLAEEDGRNPGFLGYYVFPTCQYTVAGTRGGGGIKISVGVNPWSPTTRRHDIGAMCARFGGGGHPVVGGVTLRADEGPRAKATLAAITAELATTS